LRSEKGEATYMRGWSNIKKVLWVAIGQIAEKVKGDSRNPIG